MCASLFLKVHAHHMNELSCLKAVVISPDKCAVCPSLVHPFSPFESLGHPTVMEIQYGWLNLNREMWEVTRG